ncbi:hypothetical protein RSAG8_03982, partial [Rhizoctonia solani AG-8 WAC10335]
MFLTALPSEIIIKILGLTEPTDIRSCQLVCQKLRVLVASSSYLQYILELDACGYTVPLFVRSDLSYEGMVRILSEHRNGWEDPSNHKPEFIELPPQPAISTSFTCGIFAYGYANDALNAQMDVMDTIHFHQLQSRNKSTGYSHWYHDDFGFPIEEFAFQPEIDLLILIEGVVLEQEAGTEGDMYDQRLHRTYRLHFRTISTNDPHWLAGLPVLDTRLTGNLGERKFYETRIIISLYGRMVMLRSGAENQGAKNAIVVWDWVEGIEILRINIPLSQIPPHYFSYLLSERYLVVSRTAPTSPDPSITKLGLLNIYHLRSEPGGARSVVTFELPTLCLPHTNWHYVRMASGPPRVPYTPYWSTQMEHNSSISEIAPQNQLLILLFCIPKLHDQTQYYFHSLLHIPVQILLDYAETKAEEHPSVVPWSAWGAKVTWIEISSYILPRLFSLSMRISIRNLHCYLPSSESKSQNIQESKDQLAILDFDPQRLGFARAARREQANNARDPSHSKGSEGTSSAAFMTCQDALGHPMFKTPVNMAPLYRKLHLGADFLPIQAAYDEPCMIDDEHIVIVAETYPVKCSHA